MYLEVTFHRGSPLVAYLYLLRRSGEKSVRTRRAEPGLVIDFNQKGQPMGIEILEPAKVTLPGINRVLRELGLKPLKKTDLAPLQAA